MIIVLMRGVSSGSSKQKARTDRGRAIAMTVWHVRDKKDTGEQWRVSLSSVPPHCSGGCRRLIARPSKQAPAYPQQRVPRPCPSMRRPHGGLLHSIAVQHTSIWISSFSPVSGQCDTHDIRSLQLRRFKKTLQRRACHIL